MLARLIAGAVRIVGRLPLPWLQAAGRLLGRVQLRSGGRVTRVTHTNIDACFSQLAPAARQQLAAASLEASGQLLFESAWVAAHPNVDAAVASVRGYELTAEIARSGHGAIALIPHFGNWELLHAWIAARQSLTVLFRPARSTLLAALVSHLRTRRRVAGASEGAGSTLVPADRRGVTRLLRALRAGGIVAILPDQVPVGGGGVDAPFFGRSALTVSLPARLALGAPADRPPMIMLVSACRRTDGRFDVVLERLQPAADSTESFMADINRAIEALVRRQPEQYQWEYKRFKHAPDGTDLYA